MGSMYVLNDLKRIPYLLELFPQQMFIDAIILGLYHKISKFVF